MNHLKPYSLATTFPSSGHFRLSAFKMFMDLARFWAVKCFECTRKAALEAWLVWFSYRPCARRMTQAPQLFGSASKLSNYQARKTADPRPKIQIQMRSGMERSWLVWLTFNIPLNVRCPSDASCSLHNIWFHQWQSWQKGGGDGARRPGGGGRLLGPLCAICYTKLCQTSAPWVPSAAFRRFFSAADAGVGNENICWLIAPWSQFCSHKNARKGGSSAPWRRFNALPNRSHGCNSLGYNRPVLVVQAYQNL